MTEIPREQDNNPYAVDAALHRLSSLISALGARVVTLESQVTQQQEEIAYLRAALDDDISQHYSADDAPFTPVGSRLSNLINRHGLKTHSHEMASVSEFLQDDLAAADEAVRESVEMEQLPFDGEPEPDQLNVTFTHPGDLEAMMRALLSGQDIPQPHDDDDDDQPHDDDDDEPTTYFCTLDELFDRIEGMEPVEIKLYPKEQYRELTHIRRPLDDPGRIHIQRSGDVQPGSYLKEKVVWYRIMRFDDAQPEPIS